MKRKRSNSFLDDVVDVKRRILSSGENSSRIEQIPDDTLRNVFLFVDTFSLYTNIKVVCHWWREQTLNQFVVAFHYGHFFGYDEVKVVQVSEFVNNIYIALFNTPPSIAQSMYALDSLSTQYKQHYESSSVPIEDALSASRVYKSIANRLDTITSSLIMRSKLIERRMGRLNYRSIVLNRILKFVDVGESIFFRKLNERKLFAHYMNNFNRVIVSDYEHIPSTWRDNFHTAEEFKAEVIFMGKTPGNSTTVSLSLYCEAGCQDESISRLVLDMNGFIMTQFVVDSGDEKYQIYDRNMNALRQQLIGSVACTNHIVLQFLLSVLFPTKELYNSGPFFKRSIIKLVSQYDNHIFKGELPTFIVSDSESEDISDDEAEIQEPEPPKPENPDDFAEDEFEQKQLDVIRRSTENASRVFSRTSLRSKDKIHKYSQYKPTNNHLLN